MAIGTSSDRPACARTESNHTPRAPGGSRRTTSGVRPTSVTDRVHRSSRRDVSLARSRSAGNGVPSIRATIVSARSVGDVARGGWAGRSSRSRPSATIASTTAPMIPRVVTPAASSDKAATAPGIADASDAIIAGSGKAGTHRTHTSTDRPFACEPTSRRGTIAPRATTRTPSSATRASQRRLAPRPLPSRSALIAISHPNPSWIWIDNASAETSPPSGTPGWTDQPCAGPPQPSRRVANSSFDAGVAPRPPAQTTTVPADHDACSTTSSGGRSTSAGFGGRRRSAVLRRLRTVSVKSATTYSRSSPGSERADARPSSASPIRRFSNDSDDAPPPRKSTRSSSLPRPSAMRQITLSSCVMSTIDLRSPHTRRHRPAEHTPTRRGRRDRTSRGQPTNTVAELVTSCVPPTPARPLPGEQS